MSYAFTIQKYLLSSILRVEISQLLGRGRERRAFKKRPIERAKKGKSIENAIDIPRHSFRSESSRNPRKKLAARSTRSDLNRAPTENHFFLPRRRRTRNPIDTNWEYDDSARFRVESRGGRAGSRKNSRKPRLSARFAAKVFTGKQWGVGNNTSNRGGEVKVV